MPAHLQAGFGSQVTGTPCDCPATGSPRPTSTQPTSLYSSQVHRHCRCNHDPLPPLSLPPRPLPGSQAPQALPS